MAIWGKILGGVAGFAAGGPLGAIAGATLGHALDSKKWAGNTLENVETNSLKSRQTAFTVAVVVLSAKMAKADGHVTRDEISAFKNLFDIPESEINDVGKLFNEARKDSSGFEPYAQQIGSMFKNDQNVIESLLASLFQIALADGIIHRDEDKFLLEVSKCFGLSNKDFNRIRSSFITSNKTDPYELLGVNRNMSNSDIKNIYRDLIRKNHPDILIAQGMPQEFIDTANKKMASINAAYDLISKERSI